MTKAELEARVAKLKRLLRTETERADFEAQRADSEAERANLWSNALARRGMTFSELASETNRLIREAQARELKNRARTNGGWQTITQHFINILVERDLPNQNNALKKGDRKKIRREANHRATVENKKIKKYSDNKLSKELTFPGAEHWQFDIDSEQGR